MSGNVAETTRPPRDTKGPYSFLIERNEVLIYPQPARAAAVEKLAWYVSASGRPAATN